MIIKKRTTPVEIPVLEALKRRLSPRRKIYPKLEEDFAYSQKGFDGEKAVDRFTAALLKNNLTILHDVYLHNKGSSFQIDTLIIGPHCIFVVEIKNYTGTVTFNFILKQFTREHNGKITGFRNPIIQATTNTLLLTEWLSDHTIMDIPIYPLVVISEPSTILKVIPAEKDISDVVMHGEYMPQQVMKMNQELEGNRHGHLHQKIGALILGECGTFDFDYRREYVIDHQKILSGVQCPGCGKLGMERKQKNWHCNKCGEKDKDAYIKAISDYLLLIKPSITNTECMKFLKVDSRHIVTRLLKSSGLIYDGKYKRWSRK
ncbi:NERD domain-containing protein [Virgibacillus necropolis]|uniref:nuclease-related domain-containing protein n=1 Tax=Virgibacillus necropolis TaxID=163877 RepID=UPI00384B2B47